MSGSISGEEFLNRLAASGLLSRDDLVAAVDEIGGASVISNARTLARGLVDVGRLTSFQADAILDGRLSQLFIGNYAILSRLGAGAMGTVFKARHRRMNRLVAIKVFSGDTSGPSTLSRRFEREVETIARLSHPNIVMAHDAGECEGRLYLVMEYVDGHDLGAKSPRRGRSRRPMRRTVFFRPPAGWIVLMAMALFTATSSPRTCCAIPRAWSKWPISGWPN